MKLNRLGKCRVGNMGLDRLVEVWEGRLGLMTLLVGYGAALEVGYWLVVCWV